MSTGRPASALVLAVFYAVLAGAWILFSDRALAALAPDLSSFAYFGTLKGLLFVFSTAVLLYAILKRHQHSLEAEIAERRRSEDALQESRERLRQSQKLEALGLLAGGVAHDFNNLLMVIRGHAELLRGTPGVSPRMQRSCDEIDRAVDRARSLTQQLLTFSRRQAIQRRLLDLNTVVRDTTKMLHRLVGEDIELHVRCAPGELTLHADAGMLVQVLLNLAVNARDAMPRGGRLHVDTAERTQDGRRFALLQVQDEGTGIDPAIVPRIFDPFFTTKEVGKGTGLGLATVFGVAQQHGGSVEVDGGFGRGATFRVLLPLAATGENAAAPASEERPRGGQETILLVEDDDSVRAAVVEFLAGLGYRLLQARTGAEALKIAAPFDLVITDVVMPGGVSGFDLGRQLASRRSGARIIYTSGYTPDPPGPEELHEGRNFLSKPFSLDQLARTVRVRLDEP
ncbi:MAG TPA: ATP-binding protein [Candidatus Polarisedimenticolaceae bacterium]|nr:ATP-binding protein [Candidatus Polarisedimenticolaceae bacterium]